MTEIKFRSVFSDELNTYIEHRKSCGIKDSGVIANLRKLDAFMAENCTDKRFTRDNADKWKESRNGESPRGHYRRVNDSKLFFQFIFPQGYDVFLFDDIRNPPNSFIAHYYTDDEVERYFNAVDNYHSPHNRLHCIQLPVLFRILYCCGTRISETLAIRKKDIDLESGIIRLTETKNSKERYVIMSDELLSLTRRFADRSFYQITDDEYVFRNKTGSRLKQESVSQIHRKILTMAGIPFMGDFHGPRIHDWRHTFAIRSFKQMSDNGTDMYVALPILSTYLGHGTIMATEHYLRLTLEMFPEIEDKMRKAAEKAFGGMHYESN